MNTTIPSQVAEIKLSYRTKIYASDRLKIQRSNDAYAVFIDNWDMDTIELFEEFQMLILDRQNRVMGKFTVSQGSMTGTVVDSKAVFVTALKARASSIILAHNHPSGNLKPSREDLKLTKKLIKAGKFLELPILDHLILAPDGGYFSFGDEGLMK